MKKEKKINKTRKRGFSIKLKMILILCTLYVIVLFLTAKIVMDRMREATDGYGQVIAEETAHHYSSLLSNEIDEVLYASDNLSKVLTGMTVLNQTEINIPRDVVIKIVSEFIRKKANLGGVGIYFETDKFDGLDNEYKNSPTHDTSGQFIPYFTMKGESSSPKVIPRSGYRNEPWYNEVKNSKEPVISPIYNKEIGGENILVVTLAVPILNLRNEFIGVVATDMAASILEQAITGIQIGDFKRAYVIFTTKSNQVINAADQEGTGKLLSETTSSKELIDAVAGKEDFFIKRTSSSSGSVTYSHGLTMTFGPIDSGWKTVVNIKKDELFEEAEIMQNILYVSAGASILFVIIFIIVFAGYITKPIKQASSRILEISEGDGDLTTFLTVRRMDEVGHLALNFNAFVSNLGGIIKNIQRSVRHLNTIRENLTQGTSQTVSSTEQIGANVNSIRQQIESLDDQVAGVSTAMEEINSQIVSLIAQIDSQSVNISESTASVEEMISSLTNVARITEIKKESTAQLIETARKGGDELEDAVNEFTRLTEKIDAIKEMVGIINGIASQTNLLAMNAAIEAAHAGDAGKGFAVVSDEIRKLAEGSQTNSAQISSVISEVVGTIETTALSIDKTSQTFSEINKEVFEVTNALNEINSSTQELSSGGAQILKAMTVLNQISVRVSEGSGEMKIGAIDVNKSMQQVARISSSVLEGIGEIGKGTDQISEAMQGVVDLTNQIEGESKKLASESDRFKT